MPSGKGLIITTTNEHQHKIGNNERPSTYTTHICLDCSETACLHCFNQCTCEQLREMYSSGKYGVVRINMLG